MSTNSEGGVPEKLILECLLRPTSTNQEQLDALGEESWAAIITRLRAHRVLPYLHYALAEQARLTLPKQVEKALVTSAQQWGARQLMLGRECVIMHQAFLAKDIPHLFLKGTPLAFANYPSPRLRPAQDVDILLRREDLAEARKCIAELGGGVIDVYADLPEEIEATAKHLAPIWSPNRIIPVELHARIFYADADHASPELEAFSQAMWSRAGTFAVSGVEMPCANPMDMALHLISHGAYEDSFANGPLFLLDLQMLIEGGHVDAAELYDRAVSVGIGRGAVIVLRMLGHRVEGAHVSEEMLAATSQLILQSKAEEDKRSLNFVRMFQLDGVKSLLPLLSKLTPAKSHLLYLRKENGLSGGEGWSYARLWLTLLYDRAGKLRTFMSSQTGRSSARQLLKVRGWLRAG